LIKELIDQTPVPAVKFQLADVNVDTVFIADVVRAAGPPLPPHRPVVREVLSLPNTSLSKKKLEHVISAKLSYFEIAALLAAVSPGCVPAKYDRVIDIEPEFCPLIPPTIEVEVSVTLISDLKYESVTKVLEPCIPATPPTPRAPVTVPL
jgi:hypothetical protein